MCLQLPALFLTCEENGLELATLKRGTAAERCPSFHSADNVGSASDGNIDHWGVAGVGQCCGRRQTQCYHRRWEDGHFGYTCQLESVSRRMSGIQLVGSSRSCCVSIVVPVSVTVIPGPRLENLLCVHGTLEVHVWERLFVYHRLTPTRGRTIVCVGFSDRA